VVLGGRVEDGATPEAGFAVPPFERVEDGGQLREGVLAGGGRGVVHPAQDGVAARLEYRPDKPFLRAEVAVERLLGHAHRRAQLGYADAVEAALIEQASGRVQDPLRRGGAPGTSQ
jgi:hypothetical protein